MKYLLLLALLLGVYLVWRARRADSPRETDRSQQPASAATPALPQDMVRCSRCAVHLPRDEALADAQGHLYCGTEHRDAARGP